MRPSPPEGVEIAVCPPFTALDTAVEALAGSGVAVLAQNVHWADEGAFTGEISAAMLLELGVDGALTGHSERRQLFGETDEGVGRRTAAALEAGLRVIACVGETDEEREAGPDGGGARAPGRGDPSRRRRARAADARLRAGLGDRHRQDRDAGDRRRRPTRSCAGSSTSRSSTAAR